MEKFTHLDNQGRVRMVDVGQKPETERRAVAAGKVKLSRETMAIIARNSLKKGNVYETARIAGVMAAKKTADLIPMCHPLNISHVRVDFDTDFNTCTIRIEAAVSLTGRTGVEMEALTAVSTAALTIYDMCKSYDKKIVITDIRLLSKSGGKSGTFSAEK